MDHPPLELNSEEHYFYPTYQDPGQDPGQDLDLGQGFGQDFGPHHNYSPPKVLDSRKIYEKLKNKVRFWRQTDDDADRMNTLKHETTVTTVPATTMPGPGPGPGASANTFLTQGEDDDDEHAAIAHSAPNNSNNLSPMKVTALDRSPLFDIPSTTNMDSLGPSPPVLVERLSDKLQFKRVGLKRIQDRLRRIAEAKENVAKNYNKLASEITSWCSLCLVRDSEIDLLTDLQQVLATDKRSEQTMAKLFNMIDSKLEYVAKREENMLQERKDMNSMAKKYDALRVKKGDQNMETEYLKENLQRKRNSLQQLKEQYYESLSKILREEFTRSCFTIYEMGSDLKDVTREFSLQSLEQLKSTNDSGYIDYFLEDVRKVRADKQWSKLSPREKNNPKKLAELVGNLYNGQDSLLRVASNKIPIKFSPLPLYDNISSSDTSLNRKGLKPEDEGPLDISISQYGNDKYYNNISSNQYLLKRPILPPMSRPQSHPLTALQNLRAPPMSSQGQGQGGHPRTLVSDNAHIRPYSRPSQQQQQPSLLRPKAEPSVLRNEVISENVSRESLNEMDANDHEEVVIRFGQDLTNSFIEADQLLATNAWD
ncbi:hypothetical protein C6P41_004033 [Kluyveromyces marxianus]|nr:hypothetical protein C6P41_004033 [Kluyveromyces marxianus]